jgi:glycosyltransferase involved in cell wall biosynthesis
MINNAKISLVIPVYNDAVALAACLQAIDGLNLKPYEVIVVDNNSSDGSERVAASFPFVRLLREPKQGVVYARSRGFNAARGSIIARIDADTLLPPDWLDKIATLFAQNPGLAAVSGSADYYDFVLVDIANRIDRWARSYLAARLGDRLFLQGANMAIKKSAWIKVKSRQCQGGGLHEDLDLGIHLQELGLIVGYEPELVAGLSTRRLDEHFLPFVKYCLTSPKTYKVHSVKRRLYMHVVILVVLATYFPARLVYESYDPELRSFSLRYLYGLRLRRARISPTIT